ncbi:MAG: NAD(P)/FAD-dependent oxidoreductase [Alphaproteobacteria bacterium]
MAMRSDIFSADFKEEPYWWIDAPLRRADPAPLPSRVDVAIVGSGYTGLSAALPLARAGRSVLILEANTPGEGASTRNAGNVSRTLKWSFDGLAHRYGIDLATAYYREAALAIEHLDETIRSECIDCLFKRTGRYYAAHSPRAYEALGREVDVLFKRAGYQADMIPRAEQHKHVGSNGYFGGQVVHGPGYLHGALYHRGLIDRAVEAGMTIAGNTRVTGIQRADLDFEVATSRGKLRAGQVIVATNAYTGRDGPVFDYLRRRLIPVNTYAAATEPVPPDLIKSIAPGGRPIITSHKVVFHIQPTPDGTRLIIGGRAGRRDRDMRMTAAHLHAHFAHLFPQFAPIRLARCWDGYFAFTFDYLPHIGVQDGVHYAVGCCGTGIPMGSYLGHKLALRLLGKAGESKTAFDERPFPTARFYDGDPWFLPAVMRYYNFRDSLPF